MNRIASFLAAVILAVTSTACRSEMSFGSPQGCRESQPQTIVVAVPSAQDAPSAVCPVVPAPVVVAPAAPAAPSFYEKKEVTDRLESSDPDGTKRFHEEKKMRVEGDPALNPDAPSTNGVDLRKLAEAVERLSRAQTAAPPARQAASVIPNPGPPPAGHRYHNGTIVPIRR